MNTITLHCTHCGRLISILKEDVGFEVECPLCHAVFTATVDQAADGPPQQEAESLGTTDAAQSDDSTSATTEPADASEQAAEQHAATAGDANVGNSPVFEPVFETAAREDPEDIFSSPEAATEDIFGADPAPKVEMPTEPGTEQEQTSQAGGDQQFEPQRTDEAEDQADDNEGGVISPTHADAIRRTRASGTIQLILLIFFIPYSIFATGVATWAILRMVTIRDPLERILERREAIKHDLPVPEELRVRLGDTISRGMTEVQPLAVVRTDEGDLELRFRVKNLSEDHFFNPIPAEFASYAPQAPIPRLYVFLQRDTEESERVYGGQIRWYKVDEDKKLRLVDGKLRPGEEMLVTLRTYPSQRGKVERLVRGETKLLWRLQLRRDWEKIAGRERFTCFVIGVEFDSSEIQAR